MRNDRVLLAPPGFPVQTERRLLAAALVLAFGFHLGFFVRYSAARRSLFRVSGGQKWLIPGAQMPAFDALLGPALVGFAVAALAMAALALWHWRYYYQGSRSIDLMRRLPRRWMLPLSILGLPLLEAALCLAAGALLLGADWLVYYGWTPAACLPPVG